MAINERIPSTAAQATEVEIARNANMEVDVDKWLLVAFVQATNI